MQIHWSCDQCLTFFAGGGTTSCMLCREARRLAAAQPMLATLPAHAVAAASTWPDLSAAEQHRLKGERVEREYAAAGHASMPTGIKERQAGMQGSCAGADGSARQLEPFISVVDASSGWLYSSLLDPCCKARFCLVLYTERGPVYGGETTVLQTTAEVQSQNWIED